MSETVCCYYLARSAKLPTGLYISLALISFSFFSFFIFNDVSEKKIISGSAGPIFAIFSPNESDLSADERYLDLFFTAQQLC